MAEVIEVEYRAKVDALRQEFNAFVTESKKGGKEIDAAADSNTKSYKNTSSAINAMKIQLFEMKAAERELIELRKKSNDPKQIAAYNKKIQEAKVDQANLREEIRRTGLATRETEKAGKQLVSQFKSVAATLGIAFGVAQIVAYGKEAFNLSAKAEGIRTAFSKIGGEATLEKLRVATRGATSDIELMQAALRAKNFGISTDLLAKGLELAGKVARTTGQDVTYLTDSFVDGLGRKSIRILDNLQISQVDLQKEIKKTGDFNVAVGNIIDKKLKETGIVVETTADKVAKYAAIWDNFKVSVGNTLIGYAEQVSTVFDLITGKISLQELGIKTAMEATKKGFESFSGKVLDQAKESEVKRLALLSESSKRILDLNTKLKSGLDEVQRKGSQFALQNEQQLNASLRNLNKKRVEELSDDEIKAAKKEEEDRLKRAKDEDARLLKIFLENRKEAQKILREQQDKNFKELSEAKGSAEKKENDESNKLAKLYIDEKAQIIKDGEAQITKDKKKAEEERKEIQAGAVNFLKETISAINEIQQNSFASEIQSIESTHDAQVSSLDDQLKRKIISQEQYDAKKSAIDKKAAEEERVLKTKAFEAQKQASLIATIINTASAVVAQLANPTPYVGFVLAALAAAAGAAQLAVIESQPTPKFEKGGKVKGKRHSAGGTLIEAEEEEFVVNRVDAIKNNKLLEAVNAGKTQKFIWDNYTAPILKAHQQKNAESKQSSFADNLARSLVVNSGSFKDSNLLDSLKYSRKADRENILFLVKELKGSSYNGRKW